MDRGAWRATGHGGPESQTRLSAEHTRVKRQVSWASLCTDIVRLEPVLFFGTWSAQVGHLQTLGLQGISVLSRGTSMRMRSHAAMLFMGVSLHHAA